MAWCLQNGQCRDENKFNTKLMYHVSGINVKTCVLVKLNLPPTFSYVLKCVTACHLSLGVHQTEQNHMFS